MYRQDSEIDQIRKFFINYDWSWISKDGRKWWKKYCFHYTDLTNVLSILKYEALLSRHALENNSINWKDVASGEVLEGTRNSVQDNVRFYFRPKTPPQYHIEGIKSKANIDQSVFKKQCQIPIFFLFDIVDTLSRANSKFSDGNLASPASTIYSKPTDLIKLPWHNIYHDGPYEKVRQSIIKKNRCAEIIIPTSIDLNGLKFIYCRSEAEKETLLTLISSYPNMYEKFSPIISTAGPHDLYFKKETFLESVIKTDDEIIFNFSPDTRSPGPFKVKGEFFDAGGNLILSKEKSINRVDRGLKTKIPELSKIDFILCLYLDNYLIYKNKFFNQFEFVKQNIY